MLNEISPGQELGRYELLIPIAQGGMAMVWAARLKGSRGFQKLVAIKTMLPSMIDDPSFQKMFIDEATLASKVRHPHVVEILDVGEHDQIPYLVMEWVEGEPLNVLMHHAAKHGGVPPAIAVSIALQACRGLHAAHELRDESGVLYGLVHRDVTPQNVLLTYDGVVKIVDFGVAKATRRLAAETEVGQLKGKIAYMSPEQLRGDPIDRRTDVFALGILLYMLTTGTHPFKGDDQLATIRTICSLDPARSPRKLVKGYDSGLEDVVLRALAKDPDQRFATANEMFKALGKVGQSVTDEELGDYMKSIMSARLERRRSALRSALAAADGSPSPLATPYRPESYSTDEVMTVVEPDPRKSSPDLQSTTASLRGTGMDAELSLSGVGAPTRLQGSGFARPALLMTAALLVAGGIVALFVATRSADLDNERIAAGPAQVALDLTPSAAPQQPPLPPPPAPVLDLTPLPDIEPPPPAPEAKRLGEMDAPPATKQRARTRKHSHTTKNPETDSGSSSSSDRPISPVRTPGF